MTFNRFYRDRRAGKIMGVCAGVARATDVDVVLVRVAAVILALMVPHATFILAYLVAGLVAEDLPPGA